MLQTVDSFQYFVRAPSSSKGINFIQKCYIRPLTGQFWSHFPQLIQKQIIIFIQRKILQCVGVWHVGMAFGVLLLSTKSWGPLVSARVLGRSLHHQHFTSILTTFTISNVISNYFLYRKYQGWMEQCKAVQVGHAHPSSLVPHM